MVQTHRQQHDQADEDVFIKDICDGSKYKEVSANMRKEENALHLTFTMNTGNLFICYKVCRNDLNNEHVLNSSNTYSQFTPCMVIIHLVLTPNNISISRNRLSKYKSII